MKISVQYSDGTVREFERLIHSPEAQIAVASYRDNYNEVKAILNNEKEIDLNASVLHSPTRGNGTPLVLTGSKEIAELLIDNGADVNFVYDIGNTKITALDSAIEELNKQSIKDDNTKQKRIEILIDFFTEKGAKTYTELEGDK